MSISALGIGSGLDLNGLLDQLQAGERQKLAPLTQQKQSYQSKISAYGKLSGLLSQFQTAAEKLNDASLFKSSKSTVTGDAVKAAAGADAALGNYSISVNRLASAYTVATVGIDSKTAELGAGAINLTLANGESIDATVEAGSSSLEDVRDAINAQEGGVRASIINDGDPTNPYRLVLTSTETGSEAAITSMVLPGALTKDGATEPTVDLNASVTINNIAITSQSNQLEEAIEGVTLSLVEEGDASIGITSDKEAVETAVKDFVSAYNNLQKSMSDFTRFNADTGSAGRLLGDSTLRSIQSQMRSAMGNSVGGGDFRMLSDIGVSLQLNGTLEVDEEKLSELVANDSSALSEFLAGTDTQDGLADVLNTTLEQILEDEGVLDRASSGLESSIERVNDRMAQMEVGIQRTISRYRTQFGQLDSMISSMNSTSSYLTQQFDMMNAQLGRKG